MDPRTYVPSTYSLTVGTSSGAVHSRQHLTKKELRQRIESWLKDETASTLYIEHERQLSLTPPLTEAAHG